MKFKRVLASVLAGAMVLSFAGCTSSSTGDGENTADTGENSGTSDEGKTFIIGGMGPLTGDAASYGTSVQNGAQIAIDEINAAGGVAGYTLDLVFEDDENDEEKAVNAYNMVMDEGANAILGAVTSGCCIAMIEEAQADGILTVTPSGSAQDCTKYDNNFRICFTDPLQGETMAEYISGQGYSKVAIIYDVGNDYSKGINDAFVAKAEELGMEIVADESFNTGDVDFKSQLTKIKSSGADCLFLPIYYTEVGYISEQAATVGVSLPYFGCDGWDGVIDQLQGDTTNIEGATFLTPFVATSEDEKVKAFVATYQEQFGETPDQFAADAYDGVYAIKAAIEQTGGDISNEALIAAMTEIEVDGLTGHMTFDENGEPEKEALVATIENGQYVAQ